MASMSKELLYRAAAVESCRARFADGQLIYPCWCKICMGELSPRGKLHMKVFLPESCVLHRAVSCR